MPASQPVAAQILLLCFTVVLPVVLLLCSEPRRDDIPIENDALKVTMVLPNQI